MQGGGGPRHVEPAVDDFAQVAQLLQFQGMLLDS
jgi:hypothetical protein